MSTEMHWIITFTRTLPGGILATKTVDGCQSVPSGTLRHEVYRDIKRLACELVDADPDDIAVTFFSLEPNEIGGGT